jgi:hypothetical protein
VITSRVSSADRCARIGYPTLRLPAQITQIRIAGDDAVRSTLAAPIRRVWHFVDRDPGDGA